MHLVDMNTFRRFLTSKLLLVLSVSAAQAELPALQDPINDPETGLRLQPGFEAELIYKVDKEKYGSWISMDFDAQNRLIVSDQGKKGIFRLTLPKIGESFSEENITKLDLKPSAYGLLHAFDHLYIVRHGSMSRAPILANGELGPEVKISEFDGGGEHSPHSVIVSEDGKNHHCLDEGDPAEGGRFRYGSDEEKRQLRRDDSQFHEECSPHSEHALPVLPERREDWLDSGRSEVLLRVGEGIDG
jgi:hypothetical protein